MTFISNKLQHLILSKLNSTGSHVVDRTSDLYW